MYFEEITNGIKLKLSENVTFVIIFNLWRLIKFLFWGGVIRAVKEIYHPPP